MLTTAKSLGAKEPDVESSRERNGHEAKGPGSELARDLLADSLQNKLAGERKGSVPATTLFAAVALNVPSSQRW